MVKAKIFYGNTPHPAQSKYWGNIYLQLRDDDRKEITMKKSFFYNHYKHVSTEEIAGRNDFEIIFAKYNNYMTNPLSHENRGQERLKQKGIRHTTMMVGDVIDLKGEKWIVSSVGYMKLRLV